MRIPGYLFDEDVPTNIINALISVEPSIQVRVVGQPDGPAKGTLDPDLMDWAIDAGLVIVTKDKSTMSAFAIERLATATPFAGVTIITDLRPSAGRIADDLLLGYLAADMDYWANRIEYIPFRSAKGS